MPIAVQQNKKKIIGIGRPQGAIKEFEELCRDFDIHVVERGPRGKVSRPLVVARLASEKELMTTGHPRD
jgi:hypothetical protein